MPPNGAVKTTPCRRKESLNMYTHTHKFGNNHDMPKYLQDNITNLSKGEGIQKQAYQWNSRKSWAREPSWMGVYLKEKRTEKHLGKPFKIKSIKCYTNTPSNSYV